MAFLPNMPIRKSAIRASSKSRAGIVKAMAHPTRLLVMEALMDLTVTTYKDYHLEPTIEHFLDEMRRVYIEKETPHDGSR